MAHLNFHPAPGLGDLLPGAFVVPQNPIDGESRRATSYVPRMGELLPGSFSVPQNPLIAALSSGNPLKPANMSNGAGCGCAECAGGGLSGLSGLGNMSLEEVFGTINPGYVVGGIVGLFLLMRFVKK